MKYCKLQEEDINELIILKNQVKERIIKSNLPIWLGEYPSDETLLNDIKNGFARALKINEEIIAYATLHKDSYEYEKGTFKRENLMSFGRVMVKTNYLHMHIGYKLLENIINEVKENGSIGIGILVDRCNIKALNLYKSLGFKYEGQGIFPWATLDKYTLYFDIKKTDIINYLLYENQDEKYREFSKKLTPNCNKEIIGVRVPILRKIAKNLELEYIYQCDFKTVESSLLACYLMKKVKRNAFSYLEHILPNVCCWSISDALAQEFIYAKINPKETFEYLKNLVNSNETYKIRVALVIYLRYFNNDDYNNKILNIVKTIKNRDYYVDMGLAWLLTEISIKNLELGINYVNNNFDIKLKKMYCRKMLDSYQITNEIKERIKEICRY